MDIASLNLTVENFWQVRSESGSSMFDTWPPIPSSFGSATSPCTRIGLQLALTQMQRHESLSRLPPLDVTDPLHDLRAFSPPLRYLHTTTRGTLACRQAQRPLGTLTRMPTSGERLAGRCCFYARRYNLPLSDTSALLRYHGGCLVRIRQT